MITELSTPLWFVLHSMLYGIACGALLTFVPFLRLRKKQLIAYWLVNLLIFGFWLGSQFTSENWLTTHRWAQWPVALWLNASMAYFALAASVVGLRVLFWLIRHHPKKPFLLNPNPILIPFVWLMSAYGTYEALQEPQLKHYDVYLADLPTNMEGFRFAQITDSHIGDFVSSEELRQAVLRLNNEKPDLLVMTGDLIDDERQLDDAFQALSESNAPLGVIGILGNHEKYHGLKQILAKYQTESKVAPIQLLVDQHTERTYHGQKFQITGVDFPMAPNTRGVKVEESEEEHDMAGSVIRAFDGIKPDEWNLLLAHHPNTFDFIESQNAELTVAGHTHGGQVLPLGYTVGRYRYHFHYLKGWFQRQQQQLYVSVGMGGVWPYRLGVPKEIVTFTLHRQTSAEKAQ